MESETTPVSTRVLPAEYESLCIGIIVYNPLTGHILDANQRAEAVLGYDINDLRQMQVDEYTARTHTHSDSKFLAQLRSAIDDGHQQLRWRIQRENGELRWIRFHFARFEVGEETYVRAELRDITELSETARRETLFRRVLRHNLRNEATVLMGQSERIRTNAESAVVREAADSIHSAAANVGSIVESIRQIETTMKQTGTPDVFQNATEILRDVSATVGSDYPEADISIDGEDELKLPAEESLFYALRHAVENGITHSPETEPVIRLSAEALPRTDRIKISIEDTNPPIPDCEIDSIRDQASVTTTSHGTGVGLFVIKWCIESLGGEIEIARSHPRGNKVLLYLPSMRSAAVHLESGCDAC